MKSAASTDGYAAQADALDHVVVALRPDVIASRTQRGVKRIVAFLQMLPGFLARRMDMIVKTGGNADLGHARRDEMGAARRVR